MTNREAQLGCDLLQCKLPAEIRLELVTGPGLFRRHWPLSPLPCASDRRPQDFASGHPSAARTVTAKRTPWQSIAVLRTKSRKWRGECPVNPIDVARIFSGTFSKSHGFNHGVFESVRLTDYSTPTGAKSARVVPQAYHMKIIGKRNPRFRVAIGEPGNRRSNLWRIAVRKSDVYVSTGGATPAKFSFHESGICRDAFTAEFGAPPGMQDRVMKRWKRADIPPPNSGRACCVLELVFPTDFLSTELDVPPKEIFWVDAAAPGQSRCIEMFFSADEPDVTEPLIHRAGRMPVAAVRLENGSWFYVTSHEIAFEGQEIRIPATGKRKFDFLITRQHFPSTPRSIRILIMNDPGDGDKMVSWEYGAIRSEPDVAFTVDGTLTPNRIYHSTSWESKE